VIAAVHGLLGGGVERVDVPRDISGVALAAAAVRAAGERKGGGTGEDDESGTGKLHHGDLISVGSGGGQAGDGRAKAWRLESWSKLNNSGRLGAGGFVLVVRLQETVGLYAEPNEDRRGDIDRGVSADHHAEENSDR